MISTLGVVIGNPLLAGVAGMMALKDLMAILNQTELSKRLSAVDEKRLVNAATETLTVLDKQG